MAFISDITGVILAGGQSSRFGSNKALALLHGKPLIEHVVSTVTAVFDECLLVTNSPREYEFLNLPMTGDRYRDMGPMAGIHAALSFVTTPWIFVVGCDMPAITPGLVNFLCSYRDENFDAVIPWLETGVEPLCGLYNKTALSRMEHSLENNKPKLKELLDDLTVRRINEQELLRATDDLTVFFNVNRQDDLKRL
jgi:molybdopterin-guanine dinucleotide biosynthesis protein A